MERFLNGIIPENPVYRQLLGMCPTLAVTGAMKPALTMAAATAFVLISANVIVSLIRGLLKPHLRILVFTLTIATFVTIADRDHVLYHYTRHHDGLAVKEILGNFKGYILADAHVVYDQLFNGTEDRTECGCWSHMRRYFYKSLATDPVRGMTAIKKIQKLFEIEREIKHKPPNEKLEIRKTRSKEIVDDFFEWCKKKPTTMEEAPIY